MQGPVHSQLQTQTKNKQTPGYTYLLCFTSLLAVESHPPGEKEKGRSQVALLRKKVREKQVSAFMVYQLNFLTIHNSRCVNKVCVRYMPTRNSLHVSHEQHNIAYLLLFKSRIPLKSCRRILFGSEFLYISNISEP